METEDRVFRFGPYVLDARRRQLLRGGEPLKLYPKEFDTLLALVERRGRVVEKDELLNAVWLGAAVEEGNLTTHVSHLRKLLGGAGTNRDYIATIPGRGYEFVGQVSEPARELGTLGAPNRRNPALHRSSRVQADTCRDGSHRSRRTRLLLRVAMRETPGRLFSG